VLLEKGVSVVSASKTWVADRHDAHLDLLMVISRIPVFVRCPRRFSSGLNFRARISSARNVRRLGRLISYRLLFGFGGVPCAMSQ
jgi:hypothetical protein